MKVVIWDVDWYEAEDKTDVVNVDAMKVSSFHKQLGDSVYLFVSKYDISREWDLIWIFKEQAGGTNPPLAFILNNPKVRLCGSGFPNALPIDSIIAACRPDYLLYPNQKSPFERSEYWRFLDDNGNFLPLIQDASRLREVGIKTSAIVCDNNIWQLDNKKIIQLLTKMEEMDKYVSFLEPISIEKLTSDQTIIKKFCKLKFRPQNYISWTNATKDNLQKWLEFYEYFKSIHPAIKFKPLTFATTDWCDWSTLDAKEESIYNLLNAFCLCLARNVEVGIIKNEQDPFIIRILQEFLAEGKSCWLLYITCRFHPYLKIKDWDDALQLWLSPPKWNKHFRELLLLTYKHREFCTLNEYRVVPWYVFEKEFKYSI